ncbi:MAG: TonB-dependent receptor [Acidobacteria bacterium]|nr:TonB-dependent receptor [Acidobacteriota bacterium]
MTRVSTFVVVAAVAGFVVASVPASAQSVSIRSPQSVVARAATQGDIQGLVVDTKGRPLAGAMVSALGSTVVFALTGKDGRFRFGALPTGAYTVRIHLDGFVPAPRQMVEVRSSVPALVSVALRSLTDNGSAPSTTRVLAASLLPIDGLPGGAVSGGADVDHDHTEANWRLRHLPRSVLKNVDDARGVVDGGGDAGAAAEAGRSFLGHAFDSSARFASGLFDAMPLTGQVNFVTIGSFNGPADVWSTGAVASAGVAYVSLGAPAGSLGDWAVRGALTQGGMGSWFVAGSLTARHSAEHRFLAGITYSTQHYDRSSALGIPDMSAGSRSVGTVHGSDQWTLSPNVTIGYGVTYSWQDYLSGNGLFSPRLSLTLRPANKYRVRAVAARYVVAPGAEEFLPGAGNGNGVVLPAQRTFSPWSEAEGFRPQRTDHLEVGIERDIAAFVVGFRTFYQRVGDQAGAVFAVAIPDRSVPSLGHYYVATLGDLNARGWSVSLSRAIVGGVRGVVDYSQSTARWDHSPDQSVMALWMGGRGSDQQRLHDLTTSLETDFRPTATRVYVLYKVNTGFARQMTSRGGSGLDTRFDVQVNQALPFLNFTSADWELLVAVCNLFRESNIERSPYDELLVVRPPKRVVGGVRIRF